MHTEIPSNKKTKTQKVGLALGPLLFLLMLFIESGAGQSDRDQNGGGGCAHGNLVDNGRHPLVRHGIAAHDPLPASGHY